MITYWLDDGAYDLFGFHEIEFGGRVTDSEKLVSRLIDLRGKLIAVFLELVYLIARLESSIIAKAIAFHKTNMPRL